LLGFGGAREKSLISLITACGGTSPEEQLAGFVPAYSDISQNVLASFFRYRIVLGLDVIHIRYPISDEACASGCAVRMRVARLGRASILNKNSFKPGGQWAFQ